MNHSTPQRFYLIAMLGLALISGCGPQQPGVKKDFKPPKPPPPVPVRKSVPLNPTLRDSAKAEIHTAFGSSDPVIRANAIEAVQNVPDDAQPMITQGLQDQDELVRYASAMAAGKLKLIELHDQLRDMASDPEIKVQIGVRYALHRMGDMRLSHDLEKTARDPNPRVREDTVFVLGLLGEKSAIKILTPMLMDTDADVRIGVAEALWRLGDERGLDILVAGTVSKFADTRMLCIMGLAGPKDKRVIEHIRGKLTDEWDEVTLVAARAMGELGSDEGYGVAMKYLKDTDPRRRLLAAVALGAIGRSDAQSLLSPLLLKDPEQRVRIAAASAILQLKPPAGG